MTTIDEIVDAAREQINKEIAAIEAKTAQVLRKKTRPKWGDHPNHAVHDAIVAYYRPKIANALKASPTGVRAAITSAQNKYAAAKAKTTKAGGDDIASETLAQRIAREAAQGIGMSQAELQKLMTGMAADSYVAGVHTAMTQVGSSTVYPDGFGTIAADTSWADWEPGWGEAADLTKLGGWQSILDSLDITIKGITQTNLDRIETQLAQGLASGDSSTTIGNNISDMVGSDTRAQLIADTETGRMLNLASIDTYSASGIEQWEWLSEDDDRTCPACDALDGQTFNVEDGSSGGGDDDSDSGGDDDSSSDDSDATKAADDDEDDQDPPPLHAGCRCQTLPVVNVPGVDTSREALSPDSDWV